MFRKKPEVSTQVHDATYNFKLYFKIFNTFATCINYYVKLISEVLRWFLLAVEVNKGESLWRPLWCTTLNFLFSMSRLLGWTPFCAKGKSEHANSIKRISFIPFIKEFCLSKNKLKDKYDKNCLFSF
jgi:hypothetical protein